MIRLLLIAFVGLSTLATAQELPPGGDDWNLPPIGAEPTEQETEEKSGWMVNSPLMRIGWPEMHFPTLRRNRETGEPGLLTAPLARVQSTTRGMATRTRDTWNGAVERMKLRLPGGSTNDQATDQNAEQVAENAPRQRFWSSWFGEQKPSDSELGPESVPDLMAREPATTVR